MSSVRIYHKTNIFIHCKQRTILRALSSFVYPLAVLNHHLSAAKIVLGMPLTHHTNSLPRLVMHRQARSLLSGSDCCICILIVFCHPIIGSIVHQGNGWGTRYYSSLHDTSLIRYTLTASRYNASSLCNLLCQMCPLTSSQPWSPMIPPSQMPKGPDNGETIPRPFFHHT